LNYSKMAFRKLLTFYINIDVENFGIP